MRGLLTGSDGDALDVSDEVIDKLQQAMTAQGVVFVPADQASGAPAQASTGTNDDRAARLLELIERQCRDL